MREPNKVDNVRAYLSDTSRSRWPLRNCQVVVCVFLCYLIDVMNTNTELHQGDGPACAALTKSGNPCRRKPRESGYCFSHDPSTKDERDAARVKEGKNSSQAARLEKLLPSHLHPMFDGLEAAMKELREGRLDPRQATAMASLVGAMLKVIKAGEEEASTDLPPQFIVDNLNEWYADLRKLRQLTPRLEVPPEEVDRVEAELDEFERHYGRDIKLPKEVL